MLDYTGMTNTLSFSQTGSQRISAGGINYYSDVSAKFDVDAKSSAMSVKYMFNPHSDLYYWVKLGQGNYELEIPSDTVKNRLSSRENGLIVGAGVRKMLFPDTIVTPAIAVELNATVSDYKLDGFKPGNGADTVVSDELSLAQLEAALIISKKYRMLEPYGALKISHNQSSLWDNESTAKIDGSTDTVGLVAGVKIRVFQKESLVFEGGFIDENYVSAAWNIEF